MTTTADSLPLSKTPEQAPVPHARKRLLFPALGLFIACLPAPLLMAAYTWVQCYRQIDPITGMTIVESEGVAYVIGMGVPLVGLGLVKLLLGSLPLYFGLRLKRKNVVIMATVLAGAPIFSTCFLLDTIFAAWLFVAIEFAGIKRAFNS